MRDMLSGALSHLLSHAQASGEARAGTCWTNLSPLGPGIAEAAMHCHFVFRSVCPKGGAQQGPGAKLVDDLPTAQWFCGDRGMASVHPRSELHAWLPGPVLQWSEPR